MNTEQNSITIISTDSAKILKYYQKIMKLTISAERCEKKINLKNCQVTRTIEIQFGISVYGIYSKFSFCLVFAFRIIHI